MHLIYRKEETAKAAAQIAMPEPEVATAAVEERRVLRLHGRHPRLRQLGPQRRRASRLSVLSRRSDRVSRSRGGSSARRRRVVTIVDTQARRRCSPPHCCRAWKNVEKNTCSTNGSTACAGPSCWPSWRPSSSWSTRWFSRGRVAEWVGVDLGLHQADPAPAAVRRSRCPASCSVGPVRTTKASSRPDWINAAVGGNSLRANLLASVAGAFMYFATLTEVPIVQGLMGSGMGKGPALALLLAGPALSLPSMLVIRSIMGTGKDRRLSCRWWL